MTFEFSFSIRVKKYWIFSNHFIKLSYTDNFSEILWIEVQRVLIDWASLATSIWGYSLFLALLFYYSC